MSAPPRGGEGGGGVWKCIHCKRELPGTLSLPFCPFCRNAQDIPTEQPSPTKEPVSPAVSEAVQKPENVKPDTGASNEPRTPNLYPSLTDTSLMDISSDSDSYTSPQVSPQRKRPNEEAEPRGGEKKRARSIDGTPSPHPPPPMETPQDDSPIDAKCKIPPQDVRVKLEQRLLDDMYYENEDFAMVQQYLPVEGEIERDHSKNLTRAPINRQPDIEIVKVETQSPPPPSQPPAKQQQAQPPPQTPPRARYSDKAADLPLEPKAPPPGDNGNQQPSAQNQQQFVFGNQARGNMGARGAGGSHTSVPATPKSTHPESSADSSTHPRIDSDDDNTGYEGNDDKASSAAGYAHQYDTRYKAVAIAPAIHDRCSVIVTFNVIIPKNFWLWDNRTRLHLRFGHDGLGDWKDIGDFRPHREQGDLGKNKIWMQCVLHIDVSILKGRPIAYKYVVDSPNRKGAHPWEVLHETLIKHPRTNRALSVPAASCHHGGKYNVYDGMAFPQSQPSTLTGVFKKFFGLYDESDLKKSIPSHLHAQEESLRSFLQWHKRILVNMEFSKTSKIVFKDFVDEIVAIFLQLRSQTTCFDKVPAYNNIRHVFELVKELKKWLFEIAAELKSIGVKSPSANGRRICSVLVILCVLHRLSDKLQYFKSDEISMLFSMLCLKPDVSKYPYNCIDLKFVQAYVNDGDKDAVAALEHFLPFCDFKGTDWVNAIMLKDLLGNVGMFQPPMMDANQIKWADNFTGQANVKYAIASATSRLIIDKYAVLEPLLMLDPLLLPLLVEACPSGDLPAVFSIIPTYLSAAMILKIIKSFHVISSTGSEPIARLIENCSNVLRRTSFIDKLYEVEATFETVKMLSYELIKKLSTCNEKTSEAVDRALSLLFYTAEMFESGARVAGAGDGFDRNIKDMWDQLKQIIMKNWINPTFSATFGDYRPETTFRRASFPKAEKEIMNFVKLARVDCPQAFKQEWCDDVLQNILKSRVAKVPNEPAIRIEFVRILEPIDNPHGIVVDVLMEAVTQSFEAMNTQSDKDLEQLYDITGKYRSAVGRIIEKLLAKKYPSGIEKLSLDALLKWTFWPTCITIYRSELMSDSEKSCLPDRCTDICSLADSVVDTLLDSIMSGMVTGKDMEKVLKKQHEIERLYNAHQGTNVDHFRVVMNQRATEWNAFKERRKVLDSFCRELGKAKLNIEGFENFKTEIADNFSEMPINQLCTSEGEDVSFRCFQQVKSLEPILKYFYFFHDAYPSDVFQKVWKSKLTEVSRLKQTLSFSGVVDLIWRPVATACCQLVESVRDRSILLKDVDRYFSEFRGQHVYDHLLSLYKAIEACHGRRTDTGGWVREAVNHMEEYWSLCEQAEAANTVLGLKRSLHLTGDFSTIEDVASRVTASLEGAKLASIDKRFLEAKSFLAQITSDPEKIECLKRFAECTNLVEWMRKETTDVNDLHKFVSVALHTSAGEGDYSSDKLSNLKTVGSGFGPLIYTLKKDPSFRTFQEGCKAVWDAIKQTPKLPKYLAACSIELEWYKSVKETQASVEVTSFGQMDNIFHYGCYTIGSNKAQICHSYHEVIRLSLKEKERQKRLTKKNYNLEELRDLESKLVLITGSRAENREHVDIFIDTLHSICRIAEVLLTLQQVGNVKYTGWVLQVPCATSRTLIGELQKLAKQMEEELREWKEVVKNRREEFYELNYYTTQQLLKLRKELGGLKGVDQATATVHRNILALLHSISPAVNSSIVSNAVCRVLAEYASGALAEPALVEGDPGEMDEVFTASSHVQEIQSSANELLQSTHADASTSEPVAKPLPTLTEDILTVEQKEIMANICNRLNCSKQLVLRCFEECSAEDNYDYMTWCNERLEEDEAMETGEYSEDEEGSVSDSSEAASDASGSDMEEEREFHYSSSTTEKKAAKSLHSSASSSVLTPRIITVEKTIREPVDENNSIVLDLVNAGFPVDMSVDAVAKYETLEAALEHLEMMEEEGDEEEKRLIPVKTQLSREDSRGADVQMDWDYGAPPTIYREKKAEDKYLKLEHLGMVLRHLSEEVQGEVKEQRTFPAEVLKKGSPNLLVVPPDHVLKTALCLYMENHRDDPLPTPEEVLVCTPSTTAEEIQLFWIRAISDPGYRRIFSLIHAEKLSYHVSDQALSSLSRHSQGKQDYRLVIICSNEDEEMSHFISKLHLFRRPFIPRSDPKEYRNYLAAKFTQRSQDCGDAVPAIPASIVDYETSSVRIVTSVRSGMGKSLYIQRLGENLRVNLGQVDPVHVTIPLHGPVVTPDTVLELFKDHFKRPTCCIYHVDIAPNILWEVDTILFSLLILRGLCDSQGRVWRCHPNQLYAVEVTLPDRENLPEREKKFFPESRTVSLLNLLPSVQCLSPQRARELSPESALNSLVLMDQGEFCSDSYQRVFQYLRRYTAGINLDAFTFKPAVEGAPKDCLDLLLVYCGVKDPSWSEIRHFVRFLDLQLQSCEASVFTDPTFVGDVMAGLKGFVVKFMIRMSRDFSTSSLQVEVALEMNEAVEGDDIEKYQISERKRWEQSPHPYIFFNQDRVSITFVGFTVTKQGDLINPTTNAVLERAIMTSQLYAGLQHNRVNFQDDHRTWTKQAMIERISTVMGVEYVYDPDETYVLTVDNVIKILAIQMRFRCGIPVVVMGETGCGKTRLIRYMCDLARQGMDKRNMMILKVHGGTTEEDIARFIQQAERESVDNTRANIDTVVFFDEANTTDAIGLIKEIMCDRRINGRSIADDLKFIAACNPYRRHSENMIERLENAGLGFFVRATETQQKLGKIPLRQLVYRVLDLPPSMRPLVYDFGQLNTDTEQDYIKQIVHDHIKKHDGLKGYLTTISTPIAGALNWSQWYMRNRKDECSFVSLRDVERAMIVFEFMYDMMGEFGDRMDEWARGEQRHADNKDDEEGDFAGYASPGPIARALVLALSVCYHARLQNRAEYEDGVATHFRGPIQLQGGAQQFRDEIRWCQEALLDDMQIGDNIARNAALRENVFMMAVCVELRIPLFLVGKPGSSKSLAKSIINESMRGKDSRRDLLKKFKEVTIFSYQCSRLSTPESVIEVFNNASKFQAKQDINNSVAVVVLDEVGLAEDSPNLPLKALHPLLEDGTEGAKKDYTDQIIARQERVAFIGISNWALDPAKMNRGVMVTRADPSEEELVFSAKGICFNRKNKKDTMIKENLEGYFRHFAQAYIAICKRQRREFFGLRDFYSLIKMLYYMCDKSGRRPTSRQLEHAIRRNFGGLESDNWSPFQEFEDLIPMDQQIPDVPEELRAVVNPDCSRLGLIRTSLDSREKTWQGENRYVLFLTENYAALDILKNPKNYLSLSDELNVAQSTGDVAANDIQPFILFGSSFPKDKEYTQVCRNINQIKICMETGRTVILLNLENLYESLYDVLNQYYIYHADNKYVDLGLQTHRVRCRVDDKFKLILIAEKDTVYEKFPTPLINRMEKHFVLTSSVLEGWQETVLHQLEKWITQFCNTGDSRFKKSDAFIGFQKDTPASVVFQASNMLKAACAGLRGTMEGIEERWENVMQWSGLTVDDMYMEEEGELRDWEEAILKLSKFLLLETASPDSIVRLRNTELVEETVAIKQIYFEQQHHHSINDFLTYQVHSNHRDGGLLMQVTTHSHLLSQSELEDVEMAINARVSAFFLHEFDTELDFSNKVGPLFKCDDTTMPGKRLVIIQCDSGHEIGDLIACARYRIYDLRAKADQRQVTHVVFIIHLPHHVDSSSFVGFQGDPWVSSHVDDLRTTTDTAVSANEAIGLTISELFCGRPDAKHDVVQYENTSMQNEYSSSYHEAEFSESHEMSEDLEIPGPEASLPRQRTSSQGSEMSEGDHEVWGERVGIRGDDDVAMETESDTSLPPPQEQGAMTVEDIETESLEFADVREKNLDAQVLDLDEFERDVKEKMNTTNNITLSEIADTSGVSDFSFSQPQPLAVVPEHAGLGTQDAEYQPFEFSNPPVVQRPAAADQEQFPSVVKCPLYRRLHGCIQAAASKLKDFTDKRATKRVEILVRLIPKDTTQPDPTQFHGLLIEHIHKVLRERDQQREDVRDWVINEAMNAKSLQHGGTFRNALSRKVDEVIIPIFSEIIASIDQNYNLNLIDPRNANTPLFKFWLSMFQNQNIMQFNYRDMVIPREQIPGVGGRKAEEDFKCALPFSWLVFEAVDCQWDNARSAGGNDKLATHKQLCAAVEPTPIGEILVSVDGVECEEFYRNYLHDFIRIVHKCNHKDREYELQEYELISNALNALVLGEEFCSVDGNVTLLHRIAALHVVYQINKSQILWFGQLVAHSPGIMVHLRNENKYCDSNEMVLHLYAVQRALDKLVPPLDRNDPAVNLIPWLNDIRLAQNPITSILNMPCQSGLRANSRSKWDVIRLLQLFLEHVLLKQPFENAVAYLIRLELTSRSSHDFLEASTLTKVRNHLNRLTTEAKKKRLVDSKDLKPLKRHCHNYFIEVVSTLCFGGESAPEPALIKMLMDIVYTENKDLVTGNVNKVSVVRSSLLQLLLEHDPEVVKEHLEEYFSLSKGKMPSKDEDENLCLLCIMCFEDALCKQHSGRGATEDLLNILDRSYQTLKDHYKTDRTINIDYLGAVASIRFSMMEISHLLYSEDTTTPKSQHQQRLEFALIRLAEEVCSDPVINSTDFASGKDVVGPAVYLVKLLVRQYGFPGLDRVSQEQKWVVPEGLQTNDQAKVIDPFVVYNGAVQYSALRETISTALFGKQVGKLVETTQDFDVREAAVLLLAMYETITLTYSSPNRPMDDDLLEEMNQFTLNLKSFSPPMRIAARLLLINRQGGPLAQMCITPELPAQFKTLGALVVHTVAVVNTHARLPILLPFVNMLTNPGALAHAYFPTMAEDNLPELRRVLGAAFYACPRGHLYFIGNCGRPVVTGTCNTCGAPIGGQNYKFATGNTGGRNNDATQTGHALGNPDARTGPPAPERSLSPPAICIMRAIMHSALLWCACHHQDTLGELSALVKPQVPPQALPEFFWVHLMKDIEQLSRVTGRNPDESMVIVHLVLSNILLGTAPTSGAIATVSSLNAKDAREHWEKEFNTRYIQPVLGDLDIRLGAAMDAITNDDKQDHGPLFYLVYEKVRVSEDNMDPHLWSYRQRISLEHLGQTLQEKKLREKYPILHGFLQVEPSLRATQYLPDIVKLQRCLYDTFHHRLDRAIAKTQTIGQFLRGLSNENSRNEYSERINSLKKAWSLVGSNLKVHARLRLEDQHCLPAITDDTALEYLVPTTSGAGALTTSLVDYLILAHNDFIETCSGRLKDKSQTEWIKHQVPITHIHRCHLLDYEQQIVSVVLSHCCYSLKVGEAHTVQYDHQALEKHILDRFIYGKPVILSDIPHVAYRKDIYTTVTFNAVRRKVNPQKPLEPQMQKEILAELRTPDRIRDNLDVVDIVLGFLSSGGGKPDKPLGEYVDRVLKMKRRPFSQKAREYCSLQHILSLWETLSVELSKLTWLRKQEPFDTVKEQYLRELSKDGDSQVAALDTSLRTLDLDRTLGALYEFIETHVKYCPDKELGWPLKDVICADQFEYLQLDSRFADVFPDSITIAQTVAVWKHIVHYQERLKQD